jgi:GT2 family glycosyltransferase
VPSSAKLCTSSATASKFSIVIPHYTNAERTIKLVREVVRASEWLSQKHYTDDNSPSAWNCDRLIEVIVVDDASPDGSGELLEQAFEDSTGVFEDACVSGVFLRNRKNLGFARTVNRGASIATGKTLVICNTDISFCESRPLASILLKLAEVLTDTRIGTAMPLIFNIPLNEVENVNDLWANRGLLWLRRLSETSQLTDLAKLIVHSGSGNGSDEPTPGDLVAQSKLIDTVLCGAFFAMRRLDFLESGSLNPVFHPYYWEDVELGVRVSLRGMRNIALTDALVLHEHDGSIGKSTSEKKRWNAMFENQLRFTRMHGEELGVTNMHLWSLLRGLRSALKGDFYMAKRYLRG